MAIRIGVGFGNWPSSQPESALLCELFAEEGGGGSIVVVAFLSVAS